MTVATTDVPTLDRALTQTGRVLGGVSREQFALPTPCAKWNVQQLINHIIGGAFLFTEIAQGRAVTAETEPPDFAAGDYMATWEQAKGALIAAWKEPGVMDRMMTFPFGELPAPAGLNVELMESVVHCWDLAKATGQSGSLDEDLANAVYSFVHQVVPTAIRTPDGHPFAPAADVPSDAPIYSRLAGFVGRQP